MKKEEDFVMGLSIYMACLREKKRYSTAKSYQDALNSFKCFCGMEKIPSGALQPLEELSAYTEKESLYLFPFLSGTRTGEAAYKES